MNRNKIINEYSKNDFMNFLINDNEGLILTLFNDEGISIIKKSKFKEERISYILTYSLYKNELFLNDSFLDVFLNSDLSWYYASLKKFDFAIYDKMLKRSIELNQSPEVTARLFSYFNTEYKLKALSNWSYSVELLYCILKIDEPEVVQKIISTYNINLLSYDIDLRKFFLNAKEANLSSRTKQLVGEKNHIEIKVPSYMITRELAEELWKRYDIFIIRAIINDASYSTDFSLINEIIKMKEAELINNYSNIGMLSPFKEGYELFKELKAEEEKLEEGADDYDYYEKRMNFLRYINKFDFIDFNSLNNLFSNGGIERVYEYFYSLSNNTLSNYIIDYLFEENYHNIMIDVRELLDFYYRGNIVIPKNRIEIYEKIANIDLLSIEEKQKLFDCLKNVNIIEMFYDDMRLARYIVGEAIKEYSLSSETIQQFKDENLSKKYGVDVYNIEDAFFFGIVKSGRNMMDKFPTGHSYSLIGNAGIATFGDVKDSNTFLYDSNDMNPEQLIHVFPFDSFTYYHPFEHSVNPTRRVNVLMMPDELMDASQFYNEVLLLERGTDEVGLESSIPQLKKIALYCLDEIRNQDVEAAKINNVGILLINSSKYVKSENKKATHFKYDIYDYDYFDGSFEKDKFESRR